MANDIQFDQFTLPSGMDFGSVGFSNTVEGLLNQLNDMFAGLMTSIDQMVKDEYRARLNEAALASGGVITARETELIDKAVNGTITKAEEEELISLFPPHYFDQQSDFSGVTAEDLIDLVGQPLSPESAAAATELRRRASLDGYISPELNAMLNHARLNAGLTEAEQTRLYQLLQAEDVY